jgi:hypothetical protein
MKAVSFDEYFKVSAVAEYAGSEDSGQSSNAFWHRSRKESSNEFGNIFRIACDEIKQEPGNTHQTKGYDSMPSTSFVHMVLVR